MEDGRPAKYHHEIQRRLATSRASFGELEQILLDAGTRGGKSSRISLAFRASDELQRLRLQRRLAQHGGELWRLSLQIRTLYRREFRAWKSSKLEALLRNSGQWKEISRLHATLVRQVPEQPQANEFANMLEQVFAGSPDEVMAAAPVLSENDWHKDQLLMAIKRLKANKSADEKGLVAELLHFASDDFLDRVLGPLNDLMHSPQVPVDWRKTIFNMLPKHGRAKVPAEYRPIASIRLLYKTFAYMILGRVEPVLEAAQPEEQHGFRSRRRIEEHLVTANLVIDKSWSVNMLISIISLDLSKAFDRVHWPSLWRALSQQGISDHMIWTLQNLYKNQTGQIAGTNESSRLFDIKRGVRQGCVVSPRLFCAVLEMAMGVWRGRDGRLGLGLGDGGPTLLDLRFADDILIFATTYIDAGLLLDELVTCLSHVGLILNTDKPR